MAKKAEDGPNNPFSGKPLSSQYFNILRDEAEFASAPAKVSPCQILLRSVPFNTLHRDEFLQMYQKSQFLVFVGETGSGKTTQIPQFYPIRRPTAYTTQASRLHAASPSSSHVGRATCRE